MNHFCNILLIEFIALAPFFENSIFLGAQNGNPFNLNLILKQAPTDKTQRIAFNVEKCFNREIFMYETVLPIFSKLENDFQIQKKLRYPTLYGTSRVKGSETLILEDLSKEGFMLRNKHESLDWNHCQLSLEYLARLHSLSFVLKKRNPDLFYLISNLPETFFSGTFFEYYKKFRLRNTVERATKCLDPQKEKHCIEKLLYFEENFVELFEECLSNNNNNGCNVISHGDGWSNNIFYKYKVRSNPLILKTKQ